MAKLITNPNLERPDEFYEALLDAHRDLSDNESRAFNARLILILANQIGDAEALYGALALARCNGKD